MYGVYSIYSFFSIDDKAYNFYFEDNATANQVREILFECSDKVGQGSLSYCAYITLPNKIFIDENDLNKYNIYKSVEDFVQKDEVFKKYYGEIYKQNDVTI